MQNLFQDRIDAGQRLAASLAHYEGREGIVVLGLPRGGVPVAFEVAQRLRAPLGVFVARKLGVPGHEELAMGAVAAGGVRVLNPRVVEGWGLPPELIEAITAREARELQRRELAYCGHGLRPELRGKTVLLVDDGMATGATMQAAARAVRLQRPAWLVAAAPVAAPPACAELAAEADEVVAPLKPRYFFGVGHWYEDFSQTSDEEVSALLLKARRLPVGAGPTPR